MDMKPPEKIEVGQVWVFTPHNLKNPFEEHRPCDLEVIDIRAGYIQYKYLHSGMVSSESEKTFRTLFDFSRQGE